MAPVGSVVTGVEDAELEAVGVAEEEAGVLVERRVAGSRVQELADGEAELNEENVSLSLSDDRFAIGFAGVAQQMLIWSKKPIVSIFVHR